MKIGVMFGNPETTSGGTALKYYSSARIDIRRSTQLKVGEEVIGNIIKVKVVKNKLSAPFREATFDLEYKKGISKIGELIDFGIRTKLLEKTGAWYSYKGEKVGQGREKTKQYFDDHPEIAKELELSIREQLTTDNGILEIGAPVDAAEVTVDDAAESTSSKSTKSISKSTASTSSDSAEEISASDATAAQAESEEPVESVKPAKKSKPAKKTKSLKKKSK